MADVDMENDDDTLKKVAVDGSMDYSSWPGLFPTVIARIKRIAHNDFPIPHLPSQPQQQQQARPRSPRLLAPLPSTSSDALEPSDAAPSPQENDKENASPSSSPIAARAATPAAHASSSTLQQSSSPAPPSSGNTALVLHPSQPEPELPQQNHTPDGLPPPIAAQLDEVISTLTDNFAEYPPHTIQRLAELVLRPRQHYRSLVAYLHALDRVVHVTSGANTYPLPPAIPDMSAMSLLANGVGGAGLGSPAAGANSQLTVFTGGSANNNPGSDEALGGALLTPIPWLARRTNGGTSGPGAAASEDGSSDAGSASPLSSGSSSGGGPSAQQQQPRQVASSTGAGASTGGRKMDPQVRTESTETIEGPNGMGSIETVSISINGISSMGAGVAGRGITQGELLRQEQRAGVIPLSQLARQGQAIQQQQQAAIAAGPGSGQKDEDSPMGEGDPGDGAAEDDDEIPHARGPDEIGAADTGPQPPNTSSYVINTDGSVDMQGIDVEAAIGRRLQSPGQKEAPEILVPRSPKREAQDELDSSATKRVREEEDDGDEIPQGEKQLQTDAEGDVVISGQDGDSSKTGNKPEEGSAVDADADADADVDPAAPKGGGNAPFADQDKDMGGTATGETDSKVDEEDTAKGG